MIKNTMCSLLRNATKSCNILSMMMAVRPSLNVYVLSTAWQDNQSGPRASSGIQAVENQSQMALVVWSRLLHHVLYAVSDVSLEMQSS